MHSKQQKRFFIFSFLPALAYWYLEANHSVVVASIGGMTLAFVEVIAEKLLTKHVHMLSRFNFLLIFSLSFMSYFLQEGIWFKLQPLFTGLFMGGFLLWITLYKRDSLMFETMESMQKNHPPKEFLIFIERNMGYFMLLYGIFMAYVAVELSTDQWMFFKTIGFYIVFFVFFIFNLWYFKKHKNK
jgi:intracellular septation protein